MTDPAYLEPWNRIAARNVVARFLDIYFRGAGQVFFQNNPLTGLLFAAGIAYGAVASDTLPVLWGFLIALFAATWTALLLDLDDASIRKGLFGFNAALVGVALPTFLRWDGVLAGYIVLGALASVIVTLALTAVLETWGAAPLTGPFVVTTWFLLLASYSFGLVGRLGSLGPPALPTAFRAVSPELNALSFGDAFFRGVSQVYFINNLYTGVIFLVGIFVNSPISGSMAILGSLLGLSTALAFGADPSRLKQGLYGYNSVLTAIAIGSVFYTVGWRTTVLAAFAAIVAAVVAAGLFTALSPAGIPILTSAFVITTWAFLTAKKSLAPRHNERLAESLFGRQEGR